MNQVEFQRGVENPEIIDLITPDPATGEVVLLVIERRPWGSAPEQLVQFDEKLNRYLAYVLDGFLGRQYPDYAGRPVRLQINCAEEPMRDRDLAFIEAVAMVCEQNGINFRVRVGGEEEI